jgi:hypothetical protein
MLKNRGEVSILVAMPVLGTLSVGITSAIAGLSLRLAGLQTQLSFQLVLPNPVTLTASIIASLPRLPDLLSALPTARLSLTAGLAGQIALLQGQIATLQAALSLITAAAGGKVILMTWDGPAGQFGAAVQGELASGLPGGTGPSARSYAIVLATESAATWELLGRFVANG